MAQPLNNPASQLYSQRSALSDAVRSPDREERRQAWLEYLNTASPAAPRQGSAIGDVGQAIKVGLQRLPGAATALTDIPYAGISTAYNVATGKGIDAPVFTPNSTFADWWGKETGFQPGKWADENAREYGAQTQQAQANVSAAFDAGRAENGLVGGALRGAQATLTNPRSLIPLVGESLPATLAGAGVGGVLVRGAGITSALGRAAAGGVGEGSVAAGMNLADRIDSPGGATGLDVVASAAVGATTGALGFAGGRLAQRLKLADPDLVFVGGRAALPEGAKRLNVLQRVGGGIISEGLLEEMPQSVTETIINNWADGNPLLENVDRAAVDSVFAGGAMGALFNLRGQRVDQPANLTPNAASPTGEPESGGPPDISGFTNERLTDAYRTFSRIAGAVDSTGDATIQKALEGMQRVRDELASRGVDPAVVDEQLAVVRHSELWEASEKTRLSYQEALRSDPSRANQLLARYRELRSSMQPLEEAYDGVHEQSAQRTLDRLFEQHAKDGKQLKDAVKKGQGEKAAKLRESMAARRSYIDELTSAGAQPSQTPTQQRAFAKAEEARQKEEQKAEKAAEKAASKAGGAAAQGEAGAQGSAPTPANTSFEPVYEGLDAAPDIQALRDDPALDEETRNTIFRKDGRLAGGKEAQKARAYRARLDTMSGMQLLDALENPKAEFRGALLRAYVRTPEAAQRIAEVQSVAQEPITGESLVRFASLIGLPDTQLARMRAAIGASAAGENGIDALAAAEGVSKKAYEDSLRAARENIVSAYQRLRPESAAQTVAVDVSRAQLGIAGGTESADTDAAASFVAPDEVVVQGGQRAQTADAVNASVEATRAAAIEQIMASNAPEDVKAAAVEALNAADNTVDAVGAVVSSFGFDSGVDVGAALSEMFGRGEADAEVASGFNAYAKGDQGQQLSEGGDRLGRIASADDLLERLTLAGNNRVQDLKRRIREYKRSGASEETFADDAELQAARDEVAKDIKLNKAVIAELNSQLSELETLRSQKRDIERRVSTAQRDAAVLQRQAASPQVAATREYWETAVDLFDEATAAGLPYAPPTWELLTQNSAALRAWLEEVNRMSMDMRTLKTQEQAANRLRQGVVYVLNQASIDGQFLTTADAIQLLEENSAALEQDIAAATAGVAEGRSIVSEAVANFFAENRIGEKSAAELGPFVEKLLGGEKTRLRRKREVRDDTSAAEVERMLAAVEKELSVENISAKKKAALLAEQAKLTKLLKAAQIVEAIEGAADQAAAEDAAAEENAVEDDPIIRQATDLYNAPGEKHTPKSLAAALQRAMGVKTLGPRVRIYETLDDFLANMPQYYGRVTSDAMAVALEEREVAIFADRVTVGLEKGLLMHELGVHVGLEQMLGSDTYLELVTAVMQAATTGSGDAQFDMLARAALAQVEDIDAMREKAKDPMPARERRDELLAYFVQFAVDMESAAPQQAVSILQRIADAMRVLLQHLGFGSAPAITQQDIVALAYGNAYRQLADTQYAQLRGLSDKLLDSVDGVRMSQRAQSFHSAMMQDASPTARRTMEMLGKQTRRVVRKFAFTHDLVKWAADVFNGDQLRTWDRLTRKRMYEKTLIDANIQQTLDPMIEIMGQDPQLARRIHQLELDAQYVGKWAFDPVAAGITRQPALVDPVLRRRFEALPQEAQDIIRNKMVLAAQLRREMNLAYAADVQALYDQMLANVDLANTQRIDKLEQERDKMVQQFTSRANTVMPSYLPIKRFGDYAVTFKSPELQAAFAAGDEARIERLKKQREHYIVRFHESNLAALADRDALQAQMGSRGIVQFFEREEMTRSGEFIPFNVMEGIRARLDARELQLGISQASSTAAVSLQGLTAALNRLYIEGLNQDSIRKSELERMNVEGADPNMTRAFAKYATGMSATLAALKVNRETLGAIEGMRSEMRNNTGASRDRQMEVFNEVLFRQGAIVNPTPNPVTQSVMGATSLMMLLTSPAYYIQNATQPFMLTLPYLSGQFGAAKSAARLMAAYKEIGRTWKPGLTGELARINPQTVPDAAVRKLFTELQLQGLLDVGVAADVGSLESTSNVPGAQLMASWHRKFVHMVRTVELFNRGVAAAAAMRLARDSGMSPAAAQAYAIQTVQETQGDYSAQNAPSIIARMPGGLGNVVFQFRKFQLIQLSILANLGRQALTGATAEEKAIGKRQLGYVLAMHAAVGGLMGLPAANLIGFVLANLLGDEDEPDDIELQVARAIGDRDTSDLIMRGLPTLFNMDVSSRIGMGLSTSLLPFTDVEFSRDGGAMIMASLMGPSAAQAMQMWDGVGRIQEGHLTMGVSQLLPRGLRDALRAYHYSTEGVTRWNPQRDVALSPDDLSWLDIGLQGLGWPTMTLTDRQTINRWTFKADETFDARSAELRGAYANAETAEERRQLREDWRDLQRVRRAYDYRAQSMSNLTDEPSDKRKRERDTVGGVLTDRDNRRFVQSLQR